MNPPLSGTSYPTSLITLGEADPNYTSKPKLIASSLNPYSIS